MQLLNVRYIKYMNSVELTGSTVGMFVVLLLFRLVEGKDVVWLSSKSPPLTLLDGEVALRRFEPIVKALHIEKRYNHSIC